MNWLAHVLLSPPHIECQLGNLLTDPLKGKSWEGCSTKIEEGIKIHLLIDAFTDAHAIVSQSKAKLTPRGHLKGVVLDIVYDYFLSKHWDTFCTIPREVFLDDFSFHAMESLPSYPAKAQRVIRQVVHNRQLHSYSSMEGVHAAFSRIDKRLSLRAKTKDSCKRYIPLIEAQKEELESQFLLFFPELLLAVKEASANQTIHLK